MVSQLHRFSYIGLFYIFTVLGAQAADSKALVKPSCSGVQELLAIFARKNLYQQAPEVFLPSVAAHLKVATERLTDLSPAEKMRTIVLAATSGDWLNSAEVEYRLVKNTPAFMDLTLDVSGSCFNRPDDFIRLGEETIGKGSKKVKMPPPEATQIILWHWKDPDINLVRSLELTASKDSYLISIKRDPASEGAGG